MNAGTKGFAAASMVAALFAVGCGPDKMTNTTGSNQQAVKCAGVNDCAGKGACAGTLADGGTHDCAGKNACKGQGWVEVASASDCTTKGGSVIK